jgi:hypothetical protein
MPGLANHRVESIRAKLCKCVKESDVCDLRQNVMLTVWQGVDVSGVEQRRQHVGHVHTFTAGVSLGSAFQRCLPRVRLMPAPVPGF